jgi:hypothetical protein
VMDVDALAPPQAKAVKRPAPSAADLAGIGVCCNCCFTRCFLSMIVPSCPLSAGVIVFTLVTVSAGAPASVAKPSKKVKVSCDGLPPLGAGFHVVSSLTWSAGGRRGDSGAETGILRKVLG